MLLFYILQLVNASKAENKKVNEKKAIPIEVSKEFVYRIKSDKMLTIQNPQNLNYEMRMKYQDKRDAVPIQEGAPSSVIKKKDSVNKKN